MLKPEACRDTAVSLQDESTEPQFRPTVPARHRLRGPYRLASIRRQHQK
jgi:hypothetical protein